MKIIDLLNGVDHELIKGSIETEIVDLVFDSRNVKENTAFIAINGSVVDGHDYINDAINKGANTIILEKDIVINADVNVIKLTNTRKALAFLSANLFNHPELDLTTIAITGTKGKTTTSWMIKTILECANKKVGVIGTNGIYYNDVHYAIKNTTPESYYVLKYMREMLDHGIEYFVMEVSSQALMLDRVAGIMFDYGIFTNLSLDHIGENEHKDFEDYRHWKSILFKQCKQGIFNIDDENCDYMIKEATCKINTIGFNHHSDLQVESVNLFREPHIIGIIIKTKGYIEDSFKISTPGLFSSYNALCAILVAYMLKIDVNDIKNALSNFAVKGRVEPVKVSDKFTVLIDYAHNGVSMESILTTMRDYHPKRIVTVFGCGGNRAKDRRYEMGEISGKYADLSIVTADNSRFERVEDIVNDILIGMKKTNGKYITIYNRKEAMKYSIENAEDGDIILILGKGHEDYQEIEGVRYPFDERVIIKEIMQELRMK